MSIIVDVEGTRDERVNRGWQQGVRDKEGVERKAKEVSREV